MNYPESIKFIIAMIIMMNPLGSLSIYLELTKRFSLNRKRKTAIQCGIAIVALMLLSIWAGTQFLSLLGISIAAFRTAGGIIILLIGLSMLQHQESTQVAPPQADNQQPENSHAQIAVVPLALPVIIGPGAISTLILAATDTGSSMSKLWISLLCIGLSSIMAFMMYFATIITQFLGDSFVKVITRIMGMIIMALAVNMLAVGLVELIPALK